MLLHQEMLTTITTDFESPKLTLKPRKDFILTWIIIFKKKWYKN